MTNKCCVCVCVYFDFQEPAPMTEDLLEEQSEVLAKLGTSAEGAHLRARMQSACLLSDMESFKVKQAKICTYALSSAEFSNCDVIGKTPTYISYQLPPSINIRTLLTVASVCASHTELLAALLGLMRDNREVTLCYSENHGYANNQKIYSFSVAVTTSHGPADN